MMAFAGFRIVTDCVPALPSSILAFADVPSPFARRFGIKSASFRQRTIPYQERKATEKRNCYQKVIICMGCPYLCLWRRNFALPEASSLVTAVRFLNGEEAFLLTTAAQNMRVYSENCCCAEITFLSG